MLSNIHVMLPEHVVFQEILPRAYHGLSIDTRRGLGMRPRRLRPRALCAMLEEHLKQRINTEGLMFWNERVTDDGGLIRGNPYDKTTLSILVYWISGRGEPGYSVVKNWLMLPGAPGAPVYICAMHFVTYDMFGNCLGNRFRSV